MNKVYLPKAGGSGNDPIVLGHPFLGEADSVCSQTYILIGYIPQKHQFTKEQCENIISYISTRFVRYLISIKKKTQDVTSASFQFVPVQDWSKPWTDSELYKKYNLSQSEIEHIEGHIKPLSSEALFDTDDLIDAEFADFNLYECGVYIGDVIVYTPASLEVKVAENNMLDVNGELFTIPVFTAKFMPRNKRSVSGVCQGPRYFSFNGISLYKMKESFLGGQK